MVYGKGFDDQLAFAAPVFERTRFIHGRIGNPGCMQVGIGDGAGGEARPYVDHFREMWTRAMAGFLRSATNGDYMVFAPELLQTGNYYARCFPGADGALVEEGDRWAQALLYCGLARACFHEAMRRAGQPKAL